VRVEQRAKIDLVDAQDGLNAAPCRGDELSIDQSGTERRIFDCRDDHERFNICRDHALAIGIRRIGA
jgi:hypothetical protein